MHALYSSELVLLIDFPFFRFSVMIRKWGIITRGLHPLTSSSTFGRAVDCGSCELSIPETEEHRLLFVTFSFWMPPATNCLRIARKVCMTVRDTCTNPSSRLEWQHPLALGSGYYHSGSSHSFHLSHTTDLLVVDPG